ncbi:hypothetical protein ACFU6R_25295, partial [Streptomyces sp. NPDC057499]|uniref:hypothetical protein n=1 Tax=Streptomyces sp. NPDC057499 TaxID=3346150 RepID=UPI0036C3AAEC
ARTRCGGPGRPAPRREHQENRRKRQAHHGTHHLDALIDEPDERITGADLPAVEAGDSLIRGTSPCPRQLDRLRVGHVRAGPHLLTASATAAAPHSR